MLAVCSVQATFWWWAQPCRAETELLTCLTLACLDQGCKLCGTFSGSRAKGRRTADAGCGKGSAGQGSGPDGGRRPLTGQKTEGTLCVPSVVCDHGHACPGARSVGNALRFKPYGRVFRGKNALFPLTFRRAALCRRLPCCLFKGNMFQGLLTQILLIISVYTANRPHIPRLP